jgi:ATP-dependent Clp protease protease subunit
MGLCASMGAFLLSSGDKRYALENTKIMIHEPLGGAKGQATDIMIVAEEIIRIKKKLNEILSKNTNQPLSKIEQDTERDFYMDSEQAVSYGIIDSIIKNEKKC